jgi:hypothetical protein
MNLNLLFIRGNSTKSSIKAIFRHLNSGRLQLPAHAGSSLADFSTPKIEVIRSSETSVHTRYKRHHIPEDGIIHSHSRDILRSYKIYKFVTMVY